MITCRIRARGRHCPAPLLAPVSAARRPPGRRYPAAWVALLGLAMALSTAALVPAAVPAAAQTGVWVEPVAAPVVDGYRPPAHIGAPGNRGWEYLTEPGTVVVAAGGGVVVFAGPIGGSDYVSIQHPDGRRTTYSHVATISVAVGDAVSAGEPIATSGERLHFGVRVGQEYRNPGELFTAPTPGTPGGAAPSGDGLRLIPAAERAAVERARGSAGIPSGPGVDHQAMIPPRSAITPPMATASPAMALGRWLASVEMVIARGAGAARGWSGHATDTLAGGSQQPAVGP
ncbi:MAG: M23 family metallopeptidase [Acidimicrobiales bacterium]